MSRETDDLLNIQDLIRWGTSRFNAAGLFFGHGTDNACDEARWLVAHALHLTLPLPAFFDACRVTANERAAVIELLERRIVERRPAAYLTGQTRFAGIDFLVDERTLVPRSPLAELIEDQFAPWVDAERVHRLLDLCTGNGCIGLAAAIHLPDALVDLSDLSAAALEVARANLDRLARRYEGLNERVRLFESDLFAALDGEVYDLIVSNPPYVGTAEFIDLPAEYRHEPSLALVGGDSGLDVVLRILRDAPPHLATEGVLLVEVGNTAPALEACLPRVPFTWLEFERGGSGVFLLRREQLLEYHESFVQAAAAP